MKLLLRTTSFLAGAVSLWLLMFSPESPWVVVFGCVLGFSLGMLLIGRDER